MGGILVGLKLVPKWVWWLLAAAILYRALLAWDHGRIEAAEKRGEDRAYAAVKARADDIANKGNALSLRIREHFDADARTIVDAGAAERLRGPGKSAYSCPAAAAPGGHDAPAAHDDHGVGTGMSQDQRRSVVPWGWLASRAVSCDLDAAEVRAWRDWYGGFKALTSQPRQESELGPAGSP